MSQSHSFDVKVGDELPTLTRLISGDLVIAYGAIGVPDPETARGGSFHSDPDLAAGTMYGAPIAQGVLTEALVSALITNWIPDPSGWISGSTLTSKFIGPVWYEDTLTYQARVTDIQTDGGKRRVSLDVWAENQRSEKVMVGDASVLV